MRWTWRRVLNEPVYPRYEVIRVTMAWSPNLCGQADGGFALPCHTLGSRAIPKAAAERSLQPCSGTAVNSGDEDADRTFIELGTTASHAVVEFLPTSTVVFSELRGEGCHADQGSRVSYYLITPPVPPLL